MAQSDEERLLDILQPTPDPTLAAGFKWGKLSDAGIFGFVGREQIAARGKKSINVHAPENARMALQIDSMRWPILDRASPLATEIWAERAIACEKFQEALKADAPARPVAADDGLTEQIVMRPLVVRS